MNVIETELVINFPKMLDINQIMGQIQFFAMELNAQLYPQPIHPNMLPEAPRVILATDQLRLNFGLNQMSVQVFEDPKKTHSQRFKQIYQQFRKYFDFYQSILGDEVHFFVVAKTQLSTVRKTPFETLHQKLYENFVKKDLLDESNKEPIANFSLSFAKRINHLFANYTFSAFEDRDIVIPKDHPKGVPFHFNPLTMPIKATGVQVLLNVNSLARGKHSHFLVIQDVLFQSAQLCEEIAFSYFYEDLLKELGVGLN